MQVTIQFEAQLKRVAGRPESVLSVPEGTTVADAIRETARQHESLSQHVLGAEGQPLRSLLVIVDGQALTPDEAARRPLQPGELVTLLPPISGG